MRANELQYLKTIIEQNRKGVPRGIYSVCSAHPTVIEAAVEQALEDKSILLIEATANQVNQYGGYTGMRAADFRDFVHKIVTKTGMASENIILGGDHLGPVCWQDQTSDIALEWSEQLIREYVAAGFKKIHLDCSMACLDDQLPLSDELIAMRAARLCSVAEQEARRQFDRRDILYVIGTEVPPPGGTNEEIIELEVTRPEHAAMTLKEHKRAFIKAGLEDVWNRVIGLVVQPGVEFSHTSVAQYNPDKASELKSIISSTENIVFEAHSTDYQLAENYKALVQDHFAILKVGPQLTFALREALYALSFIEQQLIDPDQQSHLVDVCEAEMTVTPKYWQKFYPGSDAKQKFLRHYSYSDRIRYYWPNPTVAAAVEKLLQNLSAVELPLPLISQYLPVLYPRVLKGQVINSPGELIKENIKTVLNDYAEACFRQTE